MGNVKVESSETLERVMQYFDDGKYRIPKFQREFVWEFSDIFDLFDSIYNDYPIGTFFLWNPPMEERKFFRSLENLNQPDFTELDRPEVFFLLDGQQRMVSLYVSINGIKFQGRDYSKISFNLEKEKFQKYVSDNENVIRVCDIWDAQTWANILEDFGKDKKEMLKNCRNNITNYPISQVKTHHESFKDVKDIFLRINERGRKLGIFDKINARLWDKQFNLRKKIQSGIDVETLDKFGFGKINGKRVSQCLSLNIEENCRKETMKNLDSREAKDNWKNTKKSIIYAVQHLQNIGVKQRDFLPYKSYLPLLSYYFFKSGNKVVSGEHKDIIDKWFWRGSLSGHYRNKTLDTMRNDLLLMKDLIKSGNRELSNQFKNDITIDDEEITYDILKEKLINSNVKRTTRAFRNLLLCILAKQNPTRFENNQNFDLTQNYYKDFYLNRHHIFPNKYLRNKGFSLSKRKSVMDITFIPQDLNKSISARSPSDYMHEFKNSNPEFNECMESHLIPFKDSSLWNDNYERFLEKRAELFIEKIGNLTGLTF